jgi:hypothetical protein
MFPKIPILGLALLPMLGFASDPAYLCRPRDMTPKKAR